MLTHLRSAVVAIVLAAAALVAAACDDSSTPSPATTPSPAASTTPPSTASATVTPTAPSTATGTNTPAPASSTPTLTPTESATEAPTTEPTEEPGDEILTIASTFTLEAVPDPLSYDIQGEPLYGNSEFLFKPTFDGPEPWVAEGIEQVEATRWRVTLRDGVKFQNGNPVDADAIVAWLTYFKENQSTDPELTLLGGPSSFEVSGPLTVDIVTPEPFPLMAFGLAHYSFPVFDAATVAAAKGDFGSLVDKGIFTGPFMWKSIEPGLVTYERNPNYWDGTPHLAGVVLKQVADEQAALQAVSAGEADIITYVAPQLKVAAEGLDNVNFVTSPGVGFTGLAIEPRIAPFDDVKVRQALAFAIDTQAVTDAIGEGIAKPMKGWFASDSDLAYDWLTYDPTRAESLLDEAGWVRDGDGPRAKDGTTLEARFYAYTDAGEAVATVVADMLDQVGFEATVRRFESYQDVPEVQRVDGGIYTVYTENIGLNGNPLGTMRGVADASYTTPGYDDWIAILEPALKSSDPAVWKQAILDAEKLNAEQAYWIPVIDTQTTHVVSDRYSELEPNPFYLLVDADLHPHDHE